MIFETNNPARQMFRGDISLIGCCVFYLLWWVLAFRPAGAIKGFRTGWLLIPASLLGVAAVVLIIRGANGADPVRSFFSARAVLLAGVISYAVLLAVTRFAFHRQVTTELLLITGWTALMFWESNALYGLELVARNGAVGLFAAAVLAAALSMACYVLYYNLDGWAGYIDGMIPLLLAAVYLAASAVLIARAGT